MKLEFAAIFGASLKGPVLFEMVIFLILLSTFGLFSLGFFSVFQNKQF